MLTLPTIYRHAARPAFLGFAVPASFHDRNFLHVFPGIHGRCRYTGFLFTGITGGISDQG
jgi:hypothetical protein